MVYPLFKTKTVEKTVKNKGVFNTQVEGKYDIKIN